MPEKRLERTRLNNPEINCVPHSFYALYHSDIAPFIEKDGTRTTILHCINCGMKTKFNRPQDEFLTELGTIYRINF